MADIAQLGIAVDSTSAVQAKTALDDLVVSGQGATATMQGLAAASGTAAAAQAKTAETAASAAVSYSAAADRLLAGLEKQIALFGASSTAIAHYNGVLAGMAEVELETYKAQTLVLEGMQEQAAAEAALAAARDAQLVSQTNFIESLRVQSETIGLSKTQLLEYKAAQLGVAEQAAPLIAAIEAQTAALATSAKAAVALGESEEAATARIAAMVEVSLTSTTAADQSAIAHERYAASVDQLAAEATAAERAGMSFNAVLEQTAISANQAAAATEKAAAANDTYNAAVVRTTAALERKLFALTATTDELIAYDGRLAGATEEEIAYQASLARSIEETTAQVAASKAAAAALTEQATAAGAASLATASVTREVVTIGREFGRGDFSRMAGSTSLLAQQMGLLDKLFTPMGLSIAGVALAIGVSADAADKAAKNLGNYGAAVTKVAEQTGASTDFIQAFNYAVASVGGKTGEAGTALDHLSLQIGKAEEGSKRAQAMFNAVGVSLSDLKSLNTEQVLTKIAEAFSGTQDNAAKFTIAQALLGSTSRDLIDVLDKGAAGLDAYAASAQGVGAVLSADVIAQADQLHVSLSTAHADWDALVTQAETVLLPTLLKVTEGLHNNGAEADVVRGFFEGVNQVFKATVAIAATVGTGLDQIAQGLVSLGQTAYYVVHGQLAEANQTIIDGFHAVQDEGNKYATFIQGLYKKIAPAAADSIGGFPIVPYDQSKSLTVPTLGKTPTDKVPGAIESAQIKAIQDDLSQIQEAYKTHLKTLQDDHRVGLVEDSDFFKQERDLNSQNLADQISHYEKLSAVIAKGVPGESKDKQIADQAKINSLRAQEANAVTAYAATQKEIDDAEIKNNNTKAAQLKDYVDLLNKQLSTQKESADAQVAALGLGSREDALMQENIKAQKDYEAAQQKLQAERDQHKIDQSTYTAELSAQTDYEKKRVELNQKSFDDMTAAQGDWEKGASKAWQNWYDQAQDVAGQTNDLFTTAFNGLSDSLTTFVQTGKLSFTSLADSIIKDLERIAIQIAVSQALKSVFNYFGIGSVGGSAAASITSSASTVYAAEGGHVSGPGTSTSDSIHAMLSNGEFVVNAAATAANRPLLEAMNGSVKSTPGQTHFAAGGFVGSTPQTVTGGSTSIVFNIDNSNKSGASSTSQGSSGPGSKSQAMQKELEAVVLAVITKYAQPGGQVNKIIKQVATG